MSDKSKQEQVIDLVKAGESTREQIKENVGCTAGSLASYLSTMSSIAKFTDAEMAPVTDPDTGLMSVTTWAQAEEAKAARAGSRKPTLSKTPAERLDAAKKRIVRCDNASLAATERADANPESRELELRRDLAGINAELASMELDRAQKAFDDAPDEVADDAPDDAPEAAGDDLL